MPLPIDLNDPKIVIRLLRDALIQLQDYSDNELVVTPRGSSFNIQDVLDQIEGEQP